MSLSSYDLREILVFQIVIIHRQGYNLGVISMRLTVALSIVFCLGMSGCSTNSEQESAQNTNLQSEWNCESETDEFGESYTCSNNGTEIEGVTWNLTVMCGSDKVSRLAILGFRSDLTQLAWPADGDTSLEVRVDSKPIELWKFAAKGESFGSFVFFDKDQFNGSNALPLENSGTWKFLFAIAGAKTFGFTIQDSEGIERSGLFNVENSAPIVAKFNVLGCKRS